jgi:hypothetical protein
MRNVSPFTLLILCLLMRIWSSVGQGRPPVPAPQLPGQGLATVYVYRLDEGVVVTNLFLWYRKTRPVYFSEQPSAGLKRKNRKIAELRDKQYFMLRLPPGKYIFDTRSMRGHLEMDVVAGGEYYLWVDQGNDCADDEGDIPTAVANPCESRNASIVSVPPERWREAMSKLKPIRSGDVRDRRLVIIPPGLQSNNSFNASGISLSFIRKIGCLS